ncbi:interleukin-32 isoform X1 [Mustela putorius furo]|uniref:Interleukin-32 isoform X1 n=1 Tax=Mustela putorius furo TaxID=9669 RepID=A0A8U0SUQ0_MUSPF|nr:interleukin-32 isoform X1 [Mustela putorius furo]
MGFSKPDKDLNEGLRLELHRLVDNYCDRHQNEPEGEDQEWVVLQELEDGFNEVLLNTVDLSYQNDSQDSSPLLPEVRQELRSRLRRSPVISLEDQDFESWDPRESFSDRVLRFFQRLLGYLLQKWRALLAWLRRAVAAGMRALCCAVETVWSVFQDFCSFMAQALGFTIQA